LTCLTFAAKNHWKYFPCIGDTNEINFQCKLCHKKEESGYKHDNRVLQSQGMGFLSHAINYTKNVNKRVWKEYLMQTVFMINL